MTDGGENSVTKASSKKHQAHPTTGYKRRFTLEVSDKSFFHAVGGRRRMLKKRWSRAGEYLIPLAGHLSQTGGQAGITAVPRDSSGPGLPKKRSQCSFLI
jgi:hypothetical protein